MVKDARLFILLCMLPWLPVKEKERRWEKAVDVPNDVYHPDINMTTA
jgi:hypothetical protein